MNHKNESNIAMQIMDCLGAKNLEGGQNGRKSWTNVAARGGGGGCRVKK